MLLGLLASGGAAWVEQFRHTARSLLALAFRGELGPADLSNIAWKLFWRHFLPLAAVGLGVAAATVALRLVTTRFGFSFKKLTPDPQRFNPISRLRDLPQQNLPSLFQAMLLLPLFLWAVYVVARDKLDAFLALPLESVETGCARIARLADGAVLEGRGALPGVRLGGPLPPVAPPQAGPAHEQAGNQGRDERPWKAIRR